MNNITSKKSVVTMLKEIYGFFAPYFNKSKKKTVALAICSIICNMISGLFFGIVSGQAIDAATNKDWGLTFIWISSELIMFLSLMAIGRWIRYQQIDNFSWSFKDIMNGTLTKILHGKLEIFKRNPSQKIMTDVDRASSLKTFIDNVTNYIIATLQFLAVTIWLGINNWLFLVIIITFVVIDYKMMDHYIPMVTELSDKRKSTYVTQQQKIKEAIVNIKDIRLSGSMDYFLNKIKELSHLETRAFLDLKKFEKLTGVKGDSFFSIMEYLVKILGLYLVIKGDWTVGTLVTMFSFTHYFTNYSAISHQMTNETIPEIHNTVSRIENILKPGQVLHGSIEKKDVNTLSISNGSFSYFDEITNESGTTTEETKILSNVNLTFEKNKVYAICGPSGCGKSTTANLLTNLERISSGEVRLDDININDISEESLPKLIGMVCQGSNLNEGAIRDQFASKPYFTEEGMIKACKTACCHDFIMSLPNGYDSKLGENGINLSGGQKQRICVALVLMQDPRILIMDEATSAQDSRIQEEIMNELKSSFKNRIVIIIAHRLGTTSFADQINMFNESGELVGSGTHGELLKNCPDYLEAVKAEVGNLAEVKIA